MSSHRSPQLSKSRFMAGLQCLKRLYLECYHRDLVDPIGARQQNMFDTGTAVGELARERFPSGKLIREDHLAHSQAVESTETLLADSTTTALFEPAFTFEKIRTRVDILNQTGGERDLIEVKSSTSFKAEHIPDIAIQLHVLEGSGVGVGEAFLMHINKSYVYDGESLDLGQLFTLVDVTSEAKTFMSDELPGNLERMWEVLKRDEVPVVETGPHCNVPYQCPFYGTCHLKETEHPIEELPRISKKAIGELRFVGIRDINAIPADHPGLTAIQQRVRECVASGEPFVSPDLASRLKEISSPVTFMDFETVSPAIPIFAGTRPYQVIPFQWSVHVRDDAGHLTHDSFLNHDGDDPRERFILSLLDAVPSEGTIVVYSAYESSVIGELAKSFPQYSDGLETIRLRTFDLLKLIRETYYHPGFHGSNSIKSVLPALVPGLSYADLGIQDGSVAAITYERMVADGTPVSDGSEARAALLAYCERDTEAMVRVLEVLVAATT